MITYKRILSSALAYTNSPSIHLVLLTAGTTLASVILINSLTTSTNTLLYALEIKTSTGSSTFIAFPKSLDMTNCFVNISGTNLVAYIYL